MAAFCRNIPAVVFDEAHEMEDTASDYFGRQISNYRFEELARDLADQMLRLLSSGRQHCCGGLSAFAKNRALSLRSFPARDGRFPFSRNEREAFLEQHRDAYDALTTALKGLGAEFAALTSKPEELTRLGTPQFRNSPGDDFPLLNPTSGISSLVRTPE